MLRAAANGLAPEWLRRAVKNGQRWAAAMTTALEELDQHYSQR